MKKRLIWLFILLLTVSGTSLYVLRPWDAEAPVESRKQIPTATAMYQDIHATVLATGKVMPQVMAKTKGCADGKLVKYVYPGKYKVGIIFLQIRVRKNGSAGT